MEEENNQNIKKSFFKRWQFGVALFIVLLVVACVAYFFFDKKDISEEKQTETPIVQTKDTSEDEQEVKIKNLGFNLDYYDSATNKAGDIEFALFDAPYDRVFVDYGYVLPAKYSADGSSKENVHPSIMLPAGTILLAPIDGIVVDTPKLYSGDYSVQISKDGEMSKEIFELEHVQNPLVKAGDKVAAGQEVAEVTDFTSEYHPGYGYFDLAVFSSGEDGQPQHLCPFLYLDDSIKDEVFSKIRALHKSWEEFTGDSSAYEDESVYPIPGCLTTDPIEG